MFNHLVRQFADEFCSSAVEFTQDMMSDCPEEYGTFVQAKNCLEHSIESAEESMLEDYLAEFCDNVRKAVKKRKVNVIDCTFDENGFKDSKYVIEEVNGRTV